MQTVEITLRNGRTVLLDFKDHPLRLNWRIARVEFATGWGASIISDSCSGEYEMGLLCYDPEVESFILYYDSSKGWEDVQPHLSRLDVVKRIQAIAEYEITEAFKEKRLDVVKRTQVQAGCRKVRIRRRS